MASGAAAATGAVRITMIPYLNSSAQHSLYRNSKVLTRRAEDGSDTAWIGVDLEARPMPVHDAYASAAHGACHGRAGRGWQGRHRLIDPQRLAQKA